MFKHAFLTVFFRGICASAVPDPPCASAGDIAGRLCANTLAIPSRNLRLVAQSETGPDDYFFPDDPEDNLDKYHIADPLRPFNIAMYHFNDKLYFYALKPAARGWRAVVPETGRTGLKNFFRNLAAPIRFVNALLQLKGEKAVAELGGFMLNSTFGVLGFGNLAKRFRRLGTGPRGLGADFRPLRRGTRILSGPAHFGSFFGQRRGGHGRRLLPRSRQLRANPWELETGLRITNAVNNDFVSNRRLRGFERGIARALRRIEERLSTATYQKRGQLAGQIGNERTIAKG